MERQRAVAQLKALGEPNRLDLFLRLAQGEMGGGDLLTSTGLSQPSLSRHIRVLREAGVVLERWVGRSAYYRLSDEPLALSVVRILGGVGTAPEVERPSVVGNMSKYESDTEPTPVRRDEEAPAAPAPMEDWLL